ncbi:MAG: hypothetical protein K2X87_13805 [Gemmataceae bacterium]|nr:hypothetical protein [Gemmataceae bacterium]
MILLFPDVETVRLALTGGLVPAEITLAPAAVSADPQGRVYVEPRGAVPRPVAKTLDKLGVKGSKRHGSDEVREVGSWVEVLPLAKAAGPPAVGSQTPVLFELDDPADLPSFVTEMLRLGNDRQGFRAFAGPTPDADDRVLLRVLGPPYYTLLRALDPAAAGVRAYLERFTGTRVWVQAGYDHPLAAQVKVPDGQLALVRPPADWRFLDDAPFQDVYEVLRFDLPARPTHLAEAGPPDKLAVPLRLAAGNAADVPEFWVLLGDAVARLDALARDADDRLVERLTFAVATRPDGERAVVLRTRPSKLAPPALPLDDAVGYKPFWKLPNLFLPAGRRLHPTLRRDAVRNLLAPDPDQVVWLEPGDGGRFTPRSLPDAAFRPLANWVDYVIESNREPLAAWIGATTFDFEHFVCKDAAGPKPPADKPEPAAKGRDAGPKADRPAPAKKPPAKPTAPARVVAEVVPEAEEVRPRDEWAERRAALEAKFLEVDGPLDDPTRLALWPELAAANAGVGEPAEAALCWLNASWTEPDPPADWLDRWVRSEGITGPVAAAEFVARLARLHPSLQDARAVVASFLWLAGRPKPPDWLAGKLPAVQAYLDAHQAALPVRAVWLAAVRLARLTGSDVLGLARARDRLLLRLLQEGLSPERDLPAFLRFAGSRDATRLRAAREKCLELHRTVRAWAEPAPVNLPYVDLYFAYALARLGESHPARDLLDQARRVLDQPPPGGADDPKAWADHKRREAVTGSVAGRFLFGAFRSRVEEALAGKPAGGPLAPDQLAAAAAVAQQGRVPAPTGGSNPYRTADYVISRLRQESDIIDAEEKREAYAVIHASTSDKLGQELHGLPGVREPARLAARVRQLYREGVAEKAPAEARFQVLHAALPLAPRAGEAFALELLDLVPAVLTHPGLPAPPDTTRKQGELIERALVVAAHYGRGEAVQKVVDQFARLLRAKPEAGRFTLVNVVAGRTLRTLRKLGLRDEIDGLLTRIRTEVLGGADLPALRRQYAGRKPEEWADALQVLLTLAAGWLTFGLDGRAGPILAAARDDLLGKDRPKFPPKDYTAVARAYVAAIGHGRADAALPRIAELFGRMDPAAVENVWTGSPVYSRLRLGLVEEVVLALVSDDFALGPTARRWLDEDEYVVRRRVHADMAALRGQADRHAH